MAIKKQTVCIMTLSLVSSISPFILLQSWPFPPSSLQLGIWIWTRDRSSLILSSAGSSTQTRFSLFRIECSDFFSFLWSRAPFSLIFDFFISSRPMIDDGRRSCNELFVSWSVLDNFSVDRILFSVVRKAEVRLADWLMEGLADLLADW